MPTRWWSATPKASGSRCSPTPPPAGCSGSIARQPRRWRRGRLDRSIYAGKRYAPVSLVQYGRGCRFACDFCSIHAFYGTDRDQRDPGRRRRGDAHAAARRLMFFVDDNIFGDATTFERADAGAGPARQMRWSCQITIDVARDDALLDLMARAAAVGAHRLRVAGPRQPRADGQELELGRRQLRRRRSERFHARGIMIYGTFVFGYDDDTPRASTAPPSSRARSRSASPISTR